MSHTSLSENQAESGEVGCTCSIGGPFQGMCPVHWAPKRKLPTGGTFTITYHDGYGHSGTSDPLIYNDRLRGSAMLQAIQRCQQQAQS
jgi:hypothetical protein